MKKLKKILCLLILFTVLKPAFADNTSFDIGDLFFFVCPRILEEGYITDVRLGTRYTENYAGELFFRYSKENGNEKYAEDMEDSLVAFDEKNYEIFFLPIERILSSSRTSQFRIGPGIYYNYNTVTEKGFFNQPDLATWGKEPVNSYSNDFSMHTFGLLLGSSFFIKLPEFFEIYGNLGVVPIFYFTSEQEMAIKPFIATKADYTQKGSGKPYIYADINIIMGYLSLDFLYDHTRLKYKLIDFDASMNWYNPTRTIYLNSFKFEAALLIPTSECSKSKIGFGYSWNSYQLDSDKPVWKKQYYFVFNSSVN